jgi:hypothetical protein
MNEKLTAVEWLSQNIPDLGKYIPFGVSMELHAKFQQAKQMEKQQIIDAVDETISEMGMYKSSMTYENGEQYYKEKL